MDIDEIKLTLENNVEQLKDDEYIQHLERDNFLLRKQQIKYRNLVNGHKLDKDRLQMEINKLIDENVKLVDSIKELRHFRMT
tara:strand:- start:134 stop:379 length:246 start_codon:yes stop_codon:yes gene_type:complete